MNLFFSEVTFSFPGAVRIPTAHLIVSIRTKKQKQHRTEKKNIIIAHSANNFLVQLHNLETNDI